jgi:acetyl esterase/lipase
MNDAAYNHAMTAHPHKTPTARRALLAALAACLLLAACAPSAAQNVLTYRLRRALGTAPGTAAPYTGPTGAIEGQVLAAGLPLPGAQVVVAEDNGTPHRAATDGAGRYRIEGLPPGAYVPAAVAVGMREATLPGLLGVSGYVRVAPSATVPAPPFHLEPLPPPALPQPLAASVAFSLTARSIVTTTFPAGATALRQDARFVRDGVVVDTLRLFRPGPGPAERSPLLLMVYPSAVDGWQDVSVAFAAQGFTVLAISPAAARGVEMGAHAFDARIALALVEQGAFGPDTATVGEGTPRVVVLGGSFSSAIVYRLLRGLRAEGRPATGWITVGGSADAFSGAADFYAGRLAIPPQHADAIPALGLPRLQPLAFLRYSPVFLAAELPPTLIVHTAADEVVPLAQAQELEAALRAAGVPVEAWYYADTTHYLQIGPQMTDAGRAMYERILAFLAAHEQP